MAALGEKLFCVLEYHMTKSVVTVRRAFRVNYAKDRPTHKIVHAWYKQFTETGRLCKQKSSGRPLTAKMTLNIVSMLAVSPAVHTSNISSCQKKKLFQFSWSGSYPWFNPVRETLICDHI
jgi:hypothetical protein